MLCKQETTCPANRVRTGKAMMLCATAGLLCKGHLYQCCVLTGLGIAYNRSKQLNSMVMLDSANKPLPVRDMLVLQLLSL